MIQTSVGTQELSLIRNFTTAKEAWEGLDTSFMGSESMKRNKYTALRNQAEGFMRLPDENHQVMYRRLITGADAFRNVGAKHIDDFWLKDKYIDCMMSFEPIDVKTLVGRESYSSPTSQQVVHELQALKVLEQNSQDSRNPAIGMSRGTNLVLAVNTVEEVNPQEPYRTSWSMSYPEDLEYHYNGHMAFHAKTFWVDPSKSKEDNIKRNNSSGFKSLGPKSRSCYNCGDKRHFIAECPYEHRETHGGRLIPKDKSKDSNAPNKKFYNKSKKGKRPSRIVLVTKEEYSSEDDDSSSDEEETSKELAAIATTNIPSSSLFESLMMMMMMMLLPLKVKQEMLEFDEFILTLQGDTKKHVSHLMIRLAQLDDTLDKKCQIDREDSLEIAALKEEGQETITSLEERLEILEEPQDDINKLTKARDLARAKAKVLKKEKAKFGVDREKLVKDLDELDKAHKALKSEYSLLSKSNEKLKIRLASYDVPSSSTPSCDHANLVEENAKLKDELAKASSPQSKLSLDDLLSKQRSNNGKESIRFNAKAKKVNKKMAKPAQQKKKVVTNGDASKGKTIRASPAASPKPGTGADTKRGGLPHVGDYLHKPLVRALFSAPSFPRSHPTAPLISGRLASIWRVAPSRWELPAVPPPPAAGASRTRVIRPTAHGSDDEMFALLPEDEQAFDDDLREHLLIIASLQDMLDAEAERKRRRRGGSRREEGSRSQRMEGMPCCTTTTSTGQHKPTIFGAGRDEQGLFMNILHGVREFDPYFKLKADAVGVLGSHPFEVPAAMRMLAYGAPADTQDDYLRMSESTAIECICRAVVGKFGKYYLRGPTRKRLQGSWHKMLPEDFWNAWKHRLHAPGMEELSVCLARQKNWYEDVERELDIEDRRFWCMEQIYIFKDIYEPMKKVRPMQAIDVEVLSQNNHFEDAIWVTGRMGLQKLMKVQCDYNPDLIKQFYATLAFKKDEEHTMQWMSGSSPCQASFHRFAEILGYPFEGGHRLHGPQKTNKDVLFHLYDSSGAVGTTSGLLPIYGQLLRFFRATIAPSGGNNDALRGTLLDLMHHAFGCAQEGDEESYFTIDVMDYIFHEIHDTMVSRTTMPYAPYIQRLINSTAIAEE
ncbi:hypothetical protein QYE76_050207 [Lolium multiflorum]|uniref:CCHC-type domain-containing protein n=1 Tax=Lolium multiflorum TaxID=4521 RepID=A0AAD8WJ02_LOLMU|nr:hypothetical protein QYE76_050207 [Lolium multiflorum]